ncbi:hypothetical protein F4604DRAFT_1674287 [Suillus subluteus]|nr:hypothetical protein F4604DRAFT_1674287 [Suillus subluteus]
MTGSDKLLYGWTVLDHNCQWSNSAECIQRSIELRQHGCLVQAELVLVPSARTPLASTLGMWLQFLLALLQPAKCTIWATSGSGLPSSPTSPSFVSDKFLFGWIVLDYNQQWSNGAEHIQRSIEFRRRGCLVQAELVLVPSTRTPLASTLGQTFLDGDCFLSHGAEA